MESKSFDQIRFCAFCPNVCRFNYPTSGVPQKESLALSALAYAAYAVINEFIVYTKDVENLLSDLEGARSSREACPYNYDIPALLDKLREEYTAK